MKKAVVIFILFLAVIAGKSETIEKTYYFSDFKIIKTGDYFLFEFQNTLITGKTGEPALPYHSVSFLLPPGQIAESIEFIGEEETIIPGNYLLYPRQPSRPLSKGKSGEFIKNNKVYKSDNLYPESQLGEISTEFMNGYSFGISTFTPLMYNPAKGEVSYYKKVTIRITTRNASEAVEALKNLKSSESVIKNVNDFAQNKGIISLYPFNNSRTDDYQMMIITPAQFENDYQDLIDIYIRRGIKTEIITTEFIDGNITGQDLPEKIRNYIIQEYQNHNVEYILLGGDVEHVPYRGFYCYVQSGSGYEDNNIPADLYYSALDGTWNDDGDNRWGEIGEDDLLPEIAVARFSFSNISELTNMIHKSDSYQNSPVLGELRDPLLAGEHLWSSPETWGADYLELLVGFHDDNGYTTIGIPDDHNIETMYERDQSWSGSDLIAKINQGKQFVHHCGHANTTYVAHLYNSDITNSNFYQANGTDHNYTLFHTHGCICGSFEYSDCILEKMVSIQNFAVAVIGNSRYGWFNEGQTEGPAAHLHREMVDALYNEKMNHIGAAFVECKIQTAPWVTAPGQHEEGALRWNFYDINILGGPALSVWTDEPISINVIYQNSIMIGQGSTAVNVTSNGEPVEGLSCVLLSGSDIYGVGITDENGDAIITFNPATVNLGPAEIVVSGYNCLPESFAVTIIPNNGAYVLYSDYEIDDSLCNNNGLADYGETILLTIDMENVGMEDATNVEVTILTDDEFITISDDFENYGNIPTGAIVSVEDGFEIIVANNVPDNHNVEFEVEAVGQDTWISHFNIRVYAPALSIGSLIIDDEAGGNGNSILDPGETADIIIESSNFGHSDCFDASGILTSTSGYINISDTNFYIGDLPQDTTVNAVFTVTVDELASVGTSIDFNYKLTAGEYLTENTFYLSVGIVKEDFETGDFSAFNWQFSGNAPWIISNTGQYEGEYCAKSGQIGNNASSEMYIVFDVIADGNISFYRKVSSEANYDYLKFYIDNTMMGEWSGEESWAEVNYPVNAGTHTFRWVYEKDIFVTGGSDCAWVDYIVFPPVSPTTSVEDISNDEKNELMAYPNPFKENVTIKYFINSVSDVKLSVYNAIGQEITILDEALNQAAGNYEIRFNASNLQNGIYYYTLKTNNSIIVKKLILSK
ncbi:MAG: T9SS type A sorting domain-containing protein [Bacteroidetes bacterium]|nr:T9SS type A sorting domain-containing protein [Bacteroidota bacterium]